MSKNKNNKEKNYDIFERKIINKTKNDKEFCQKFKIFLDKLSKEDRDYINDNVFVDLALKSERVITTFCKMRLFTIHSKRDLVNNTKHINTFIMDIIKYTNPENKNIEDKEYKDIYAFVCPKCKLESILLNLSSEDFVDTEYVIVECPHCHTKYRVKKDNINLKKYSIPEVSPKIISYKEANLWNLVNPGSILYSFDEVHWQIADSDSSFWPDNVKFAKIES